MKGKTPVILAGLGLIGLGITIYSAIKDTINAEEEAAILTEEEEITEVTPQEKIKFVARSYKKTIIWGTMTATCFITSIVMQKKNERRLLASSVMATKMIERMKNDAINSLNLNEEDKKSTKPVNSERVNKIFEHAVLNKSTFSEDYGVELFFDSYSERFFYATSTEIIDGLYRFNRNCHMRYMGPISELYDFWGLDDNTKYKTHGYNFYDFEEDGVTPWVDIWPRTEYLDDGTRYQYLHYAWDPIRNYSVDRKLRGEYESPEDE